MANEVLFDTSGFFALMDARDPAHLKAGAGLCRNEVVRGR